MLKIYHAKNTRSVRIVWLCEELGIPYELQTLNFAPADLQSEAYLAIHPLGKVPAVDEDGLILNESGAITQYLLAKYGKGRLEPKHGTPEHAKFLHWFHFAEATFMGPLGNIAQHAFIRPE
ncbi:MAG: glutathione S-transferase, partial [Parvibaculum sp.]|nr:glutathione S-transferase [Parvibaculum sp.]